ncbi:MAG TPA: hypothetical protein VGD41_20900 [Pyrinomonadaceae bacterium]
MEEAEGDLEDFERRYSGLMDVCDLVRSARLRVIAHMKELESLTAASDRRPR